MDTWVKVLIIVGAVVMSVVVVVAMTLPTKIVRPAVRVGALMLFGVACVGVHMLPDFDPYFFRWILFVAVPGAFTYLILNRGWNARARAAKTKGKK